MEVKIIFAVNLKVPVISKLTGVKCHLYSYSGSDPLN